MHAPIGQVQGVEIDALIAQSNEAHRKSRRAAGASMRFGREAGKALLKIKEAVQSNGGRWLAWQEAYKDKFEYSTRSARLYMWLAGLSEADWQRVANMPLRDAAQELRKAEKEDRDPQDPIPTPPLAEPIATLLDVCIQQADAAAVLAYIRGLEEANEVSRAKFEEAVRAVQEQWGAQ
jgi:hypothetical protein